MNNLIETLNSCGDKFVDFALPMLIQSSVLIVILLAVDLILKKKVRATFRYCLWILVLIKLILPPTLTSPASIGKIAGDKLASIKLESSAEYESTTIAIETPIENTINALPHETASAKGSQNPAEPSLIKAAPPQPAAENLLSMHAIILVIWAAAASAILLLVIQRLFFVLSLIRQAQPAQGLLTDTLEFCRKKMNVKSPVRLKISPNATSPAACGLFRPVILIPHDLAPSLGIAHLRTVLMHELGHIKRGDLWINLAQTALQIFYFYNPLLWLANAVIRRIREQAVDEMVQVALADKAEDYPETLLNVAKLAFNRPALALRFIGVVESKSQLKERIKKMLNQPIPKTAKLGITGLVIILIAAFVLLPMASAAKNKETNGFDIFVDDFKVVPVENSGLIRLIVMIRNTGDIEIPEFKLRFYKDDYLLDLDETGKPQNGHHNAGPLKPGQQWNEATRPIGPGDGRHEFTVILDYDNRFEETDETNNTARITFQKKGNEISNVMVFFSLDGKSGIEKFKSLLSRNIDIDIRNSPDGDRLTIQYAVLAVCEQIGVPYNFKKSIELTNSKCQKYISRVRMQNIVAYKAIDRIVQPHGLSCDFDDEGLFLVEKGRTRTPGENVVTEKTTNETNVQLEDKNNQTYKVTFRPKGVFSPTNAGELLKTFNNCIQYRVETHHFRTKVKNGVLYGYILTDSNAEAKAIELMMEKSDDLEFIKAENVNDKKLAEHYASEQENLNDFNSSSGQSDKTILKNDDGRSKGKWSFSGGGHGVKFTAPSDGCTLKAVRLYGSRYGEYEAPDEDFDVWICDENFNVIKNFRFPYSLFAKRGYATWVTLKVDDVKVPKEFAICVAFDPHQTKGIYVYHDAKTSRHSYQGIPPEMQPFKDGDWLIRAVIEKPEPQTKSVSRADKMQAENIASQGWKLWRQRKLAEAEDKFKQAVDKDPANANTWNGLGWSQQNQGKKQNARYSFEKCLQIEPKHAAALNGLGWIAKGEGETDDAIEYWEKAVNASNGTATASLSGLAQTYLELGQYDKATKYYQKWLNVEPSNQEAKEGLRKARANK